MHTSDLTDDPVLPHVPDHKVLRRIGHGSYGDVWLASTLFGVYRAIKVVRRSKFENDRPFQREFKGIKNFEPVSRSHPGLVGVLHVGENETEGCFYYVMEVADDVDTGQEIDPDRYRARTLATAIAAKGRLPLSECVAIGLAVSEALAALHRAGLVHRDIKPANIIFVHGRPKLADIGLVHTIENTATCVGTQGYIPPEGSGTVQADLYALGKLLYELSTGNDRQQFPELPEFLADNEEGRAFGELNEVLLRACDPDPRRRYTSAEQFHSDLELVGAGRSLRRLRTLERRVKLFTRVAAIVVLVTLLGGATAFTLVRARTRAAQARAGQAATSLSYGSRLMADNDPFGALPWYLDAAVADAAVVKNADTHQARFGAAIEYSPHLVQCWWQPRPAYYSTFSPDGRWVAVGDDRGQVSIMERGTGRVVLNVTHAPGIPVTCLNFSPDGQRLVTAAGATPVRMWNVPEGGELASFPTAGYTYAAQFSPDGKRLLTGGTGPLLLLWDVKSGHTNAVLAGHTADVRGASFSADGERIVSGGHDGLAIIWDARTGREIRRIHQDAWIYDVSFSPDGRWIATGNSERVAQVWNATNGFPLFHPLRHRLGVCGVRFSPDGRYLVSSTYGSSVHVWDLANTAAPVGQLRHGAVVWHAEFSPDGRQLLTASRDGTVRLWELGAVALETPPTADVFSPDGSRRFVVKSNAVTVAVTLDPAISRPISAPYPAWGVICNSSGSRVLVVRAGQEPGEIVGVDLEHDVALRLPADFYVAQTNCWIAERAPVAITISSNEAVTWELIAGRRQSSWPNAAAHYGHVTLSPDGSRAAAWGGSTAQINDVQTGQAVGPVLRHDLALVSTAVFSADGERLLTACMDGAVTRGYAQVWNARTGEPIGPHLMHDDGVIAVSFSADAHWVATGGEDNTARVWEMPAGRPLPLFQHDDQVVSVHFSDDARWLVTASLDRTACVWDVQSASAVTPFLRHPARLVDARLLHDGKTLVSTVDWNRSRILKIVRETNDLSALKPVAEFLAGSAVNREADRERISKWLGSQAATWAQDRISDAAWHLEQSGRSEQGGLLFGAVFHLRCAAECGATRAQIEPRAARLKRQGANVALIP